MACTMLLNEKTFGNELPQYTEFDGYVWINSNPMAITPYFFSFHSG